MKPHSSLALFAALSVLAMPAASAALVLIDFGTNSGSAAGWDVFTTNVTNAAVTDQNSTDNDVTLTITGAGGTNNPNGGGATTVDGFAVPADANNDYFWGATNGGFITMELKNLDSGIYNVSVFEGRTTDSNGQFGRIWVGTAGNNPGSQNTGNFAGGSATVTVTVGAGDSLFYVHQEDNVGGTSGLIVNPIPEPSSALLISLGGLALLRRRR